MTAVLNPEWRLRNGFTAPISVDDPHRRDLYQGQFVIPRKPQLGVDLGTWHNPSLKLADYIDTAVVQPPPAVSRPHPGFNWGMLANDQYGDCVCAMMLHSIEDFHLDVNTIVPHFTDADALAYYHAIGGFDPNDPTNTDNGCDETVAMNMWQNGQLPRTSDGRIHKVAATVSVNATNLTELHIAIYEFVAVQFGIALPVTAQGQTEWTVIGNPSRDPDSQPGSWGGHGIPGREYDADTIKVVTWGAELLMTNQFAQAYLEEAHVVITREQLDYKRHLPPSGISWADLQSDIHKQEPAVQEKAPQPRPAPKASAPPVTKTKSPDPTSDSGDTESEEK